MAGGHCREHVVEDDEDDEDVKEANEVKEENEVNDKVFDDPVARNGYNDHFREREIRLNAIGLGADDAAPRDPIVIDLGTPTHLIQVGDFPIHGFEYEEIL